MAQLLLIFIILLGQQVLGRTADRQSMHTYEDAEAILVDCEQIQNHLMAQDTHLSSITDLRAEEQEILARAAERIEAPPTTDDAYVGTNGRLAAWLTHKVGTMTAFYVAGGLPGRLDDCRAGGRRAREATPARGPGRGPGARRNNGPVRRGRGLPIDSPITA